MPVAEVRTPVHVEGEVVATKRVGAHRHLTLTAPGVPERFRAGNFVAVSVPGHVARRALWIHRVRASSAFGPTLDVVLEPRGEGTSWLAAQPVGARVAITGPLGRAFALPKDAVSCLLVGEGYAAAPLFPLAERLRERGCAVSLVVSAPDESHLLSALEARRAVRSVTVLTADGSVGQRGGVADHVDDLLRRADADVVYAAGPSRRAARLRRGRRAGGCVEPGGPGGPDAVRHRAVPRLPAPGGRRGRGGPRRARVHRGSRRQGRPRAVGCAVSAYVPGPVMVAAGCGGTGRELEPFAGPDGLAGLDFVTRSLTLDPRAGGAGPRLVEVPGGLVNAVGLPNPGLEHFLATELPWLVRAGARVLVSIAARRWGSTPTWRGA